MKYRFSIPFFFLFPLVTFCQSLATSSWEEVISTKQGLINVYYFDVEPFSMKKDNGDLYGLEYELMVEFIDYIESYYSVELETNFIQEKVFSELYNTIRYGENGIFGIASFSVTSKRLKEVQFSPPYMPDIEVLICSNNIPVVESLDEFKEVFRNLKALNVPNTTFEKNLNEVKKYLPDLVIEDINNSNEVRKRISKEDDLFSFSELPTYLLVLKKGMRLKRQNLFKKERWGYGFIYPISGGWREPVEVFFNDPGFKPFINNLIKKYLGNDVKDLIWNVAGKDTFAISKEIMLLNKEKEIQNLQIAKKELEIHEQQLINYSVFVGMGLILVITFVVYLAYRQNRKLNETLALQNRLIENKNSELELAYGEISQKNKDITDSITYAKRIQEAIIIPKELVYKDLPDSFVYFKPKDIVSGDFYYYAKSNEEIVITAVECTGHGVPGAFMSMVGNEVLSQIIKTRGILQPSEILTQLHTGIRTALRQTEDEHGTNDGMDIALCKLNLKTKQLEYSGAMNPLYIYRKVNSGEYEMEVIKGDKMSIGGDERSREKMFTNHIVNLNKGDSFYIFSDGYIDQFGGPKNKRFMSKQFRQTLLSIQEKNMKDQESQLDNILNKWRGINSQIDDILVIGVRV